MAGRILSKNARGAQQQQNISLIATTPSLIRRTCCRIVGCLCGGDPGVQLEQMRRSACNAPCKGAPLSACGSVEGADPEHINLYWTSSSVGSPPLPGMESVMGSMLQGCFDVDDVGFPPVLFTASDMTNTVR